jgi:NitT/TauT family transport system substrate-binding protein
MPSSSVHPTRSPFRFARTLIVAAVACVLAACASGADPAGSAGGPVRMNSTGSSEELAMWIADDEGIFARNGLQVQISKVAGAGLTPIALQNGEVDLGIQTAPDFLQAVSQGLELTAVTGLSVNTPENPRLFVIAGRASGITDPAGLAGKRIGVPSRNGSFEVSTIELLRRAGADTAGIRWVEVPFAQMTAALDAQTVDAVATSVVQRGALQAAGNRVVLDLSAFSPATLVTFLSARTDWVDGHADTIAKVRASLEEAARFAQQNPQRAAQIIAARTGLPPAVAQRITPPRVEAHVQHAQLQTWADAMNHQGLLDAPVDVAKVLAR